MPNNAKTESTSGRRASSKMPLLKFRHSRTGFSEFRTGGDKLLNVIELLSLCDLERA